MTDPFVLSLIVMLLRMNVNSNSYHLWLIAFRIKTEIHQGAAILSEICSMGAAMLPENGRLL